MYLSRVRKLSSEELKRLSGLDVNELPRNVCAIPVSEFSAKHTALLPYAQKVPLISLGINFGKVCLDLGLPKDTPVSGYSFTRDRVSYSFSGKTLELPRDEFFKRYALTEKSNWYVFGRDDVCTWRNEYELEEKLEFASPEGVENCHWYYCTEEMLTVLKEAGANIPECKDGEALFYHAWW